MDPTPAIAPPAAPPAPARRLASAGRALAVAAAVLAALLLGLRVLVHFPFYDEVMHAHYLWLFSEELTPQVDFFCYYPPLGYLLALPFFRAFPESAYVLLALRYLSLGLLLLAGAIVYRHGRATTGRWAPGVLALALLAASREMASFLVEYNVDHLAALAAVGAMALMFRRPTFASVAAAAGLALLSVLVMPKYVFVLAFGLAGLLAAAWLERREAWRWLAAPAAGGLAAALAVVAVFRLHSVPLLESLRYSLVLNSAHQLDGAWSDLARTVAAQLVALPPLGLVLGLGVAGWARRSWGRTDAPALAGAGLVLGGLVMCAVAGNALEQYQAPLYLSLAMLAPYALEAFGRRLPADGPGAAGLQAGLALGAVLALLGAAPPLAREFRETTLTRSAEDPAVTPPALVALEAMDEILRLVPRDARVVALWATHPIFRRDLTAMTADAEPSFYPLLAPDDPLRRIFDPATFREALERDPPALISLWYLEYNLPAHWAELARDFVARRPDLYLAVDSRVYPGRTVHLRRDLLDAARPVSPARERRPHGPDGPR